MKFAICSLLFFMASMCVAKCPAWLDHSVNKLHSKDRLDLCKITEGKTLLLVNTASNCGFTKQFKGLEVLHKRYKDEGLVIIGFPSDDFFQEYNDSAKTANVCYVNYGVTFLMVETSAVKGSDVNLVFKHLGDTLGKPSWNFNKYLVTHTGVASQRFGSRIKPDDPNLIKSIEKALANQNRTEPKLQAKTKATLPAIKQ